MPKAPLYTVTNLRHEPRFAEIGKRMEPVDAGHSKELPLSEADAAAVAAQGFKVTDPNGKPVAGKRAKAD